MYINSVYLELTIESVVRQSDQQEAEEERQQTQQYRLSPGGGAQGPGGSGVAQVGVAAHVAVVEVVASRELVAAQSALTRHCAALLVDLDWAYNTTQYNSSGQERHLIFVLIHLTSFISRYRLIIVNQIGIVQQHQGTVLYFD